MEKEQRYAAILAENKDRIFRLCRCYVHDEEARKDAYQQVLIHVWQNLDSFEGRSQASTWIYRIAVNTCLSLLRSEQRRQRLFLSGSARFEDTIQEPPVEESTEEKENELQLLYECINELPQLDRTLVALYLEDLSTKEMADVVDISEANVRVRIHRIKKNLKEAMERKSDELG